MESPRPRAAFTLLEAAISLALVSLLLSILIPTLASARVASRRETCSHHQRALGQALHMYVEDHDGAFPLVPVQSGWRYGGVRFSPVDGEPFLDPQRPLSPYLPTDSGPGLLRCPADRGIRGETPSVGTGDRTAYRSFGTSYRGNAHLFGGDHAAAAARPVRQRQLAAAAARVMVLGDPIWYEVREGTGRDARWHGHDDMGNLLHLDGSVRFELIEPRPGTGSTLFEPTLDAGDGPPPPSS